MNNKNLVEITKPVEIFVDRLTFAEQARFLREIELLCEFGTSLGEPHVKKIKGKLWEIRFRWSKKCFRVFYFVPKQGLFVLVHAMIKKTERTPVSDIETAERRMKIYLMQKAEIAWTNKPLLVSKRD